MLAGFTAIQLEELVLRRGDHRLPKVIERDAGNVTRERRGRRGRARPWACGAGRCSGRFDGVLEDLGRFVSGLIRESG